MKMQAIQEYTHNGVLTRTTIIMSEERLYASRIYNSRLLSIYINLDGTIGDALSKIKRARELSNDMFVDFDRLRRNDLGD